MADQLLGGYWISARGTTIPSELRQCSGTLTPVKGDLVGINGSGDFASVATAPTSTSSIWGICVSDPQTGKLNAPGYTAGDSSGNPAIAAFGGVGSRAASASPTRQKYIARLSPQDLVLMTPSTDAAVIGTPYGLTRVGAADYKVNVADTSNAIVRPEGYYEPDVATGAAVRRLWVRFLTLAAN